MTNFRAIADPSDPEALRGGLELALRRCRLPGPDSLPPRRARARRTVGSVGVERSCTPAPWSRSSDHVGARLVATMRHRGTSEKKSRRLWWESGC